MWEGMIRRQTAKQERQLEAWMAKRQQEHPLPGDVTMTPDVPCGAGQRMDVFRPKDAEGVLPVLVDLHGGGFLLGKKEVNRSGAFWSSARSIPWPRRRTSSPSCAR